MQTFVLNVAKHNLGWVKCKQMLAFSRPQGIGAGWLAGYMYV